MIINDPIGGHAVTKWKKIEQILDACRKSEPKMFIPGTVQSFIHSPCIGL